MKHLAFSIYELRDGNFQASYVNPVTKMRKRHKFDKAKDAQQFKIKIEREFLSQNYVYFMETRVSQVIEQHFKDFPNSKFGERGPAFRSFCLEFSHYKMSELTWRALKAWFEKIRVERNYSDKTLNAIKSELNALFRPLIADNIIEESPLSKFKFKSAVPPRRPRVVLAVEEVNEILKNAQVFSPDGLYPYLATLIHTGARRSEIRCLSPEDIDFKTGLIHIKKSKNGRERFIRMSPTIENILRNHRQRNPEALFLNENGQKLQGDHEISRFIAKFKAYFPIDKDWGCHSLRHSFAYNFLKKGGHMYQLQAVLGHRSIDVTVDLYGQLHAQDVPCPSPYEPAPGE